MLAGLEFRCFFQAEDGIRDIGVTGVQTCALPISRQITSKVTTAPNHLDPSRLERKDFDISAIESGAGSCDEAGEQNVLTAGQNLRPTPGPLAVLLRLADDLRFTPDRRHAGQMIAIQIGNDRAVLDRKSTRLNSS